MCTYCLVLKKVVDESCDENNKQTKLTLPLTKESSFGILKLKQNLEMLKGSVKDDSKKIIQAALSSNEYEYLLLNECFAEYIWMLYVQTPIQVKLGHCEKCKSKLNTMICQSFSAYVQLNALQRQDI